MKYKRHTIFLAYIFLHSSTSALCQKTLVTDSSEQGYRTVIAGPEYKSGKFHQLMWGKHYRKEWLTPVKVPVIDLDNVSGGLIVIKEGGGRQTKTLHLKDKTGKEYVLRSIDKDYRKALPEIARGTFIEKLAKDQVSTMHPYAAVSIPGMIEAAGIYHTNPRIVFVPFTPRLGIYNETFANMLCLFEERPDGNQTKTRTFGFSDDIEGTDKMFEKTFRANDHVVDQEAYVRARLFDMMIGDWGRHEDQWRWAKFDSGDVKVYKPVPRDRDQVYTLFDGFLLKRITGVEELNHLESFNHKIKDIEKYNFPARYLDRQLTNEVPLEKWLAIASELQASVSDEVIEKSIQQMPPEIFPISGNEIIDKIISRKRDLVTYAQEYYRFINDEVEITGSYKGELFVINRINPNETEVSIYDLDEKKFPAQNPHFKRTFSRKETDEIRIFGIKGNDKFSIVGVNNPIRIRIIGGPDIDSVINESNSSKKIYYYDDDNNIILGKVNKKLSDDSAVHVYNYRGFRYDDGGMIKLPSYRNERGVYLKLGYKFTKHKWRKEPFGWEQKLYGYYSINNSSFGVDYEGQFIELLGKWNVSVLASYDEKLSNYFFGPGNETQFLQDKPFYRLFTNEVFGSAGVNRNLGRFQTIGINGIYHTIKVKRDEEGYISQKVPFDDPSVFSRKSFAGISASYLYHNYNNEIVPTKGFNLIAKATHLQNVKDNGQSVTQYEAIGGFYLPLTQAISIASRTGGATVTGDPEFYQYPSIGGGRSLRGYQRQRFHGNTIFYNNTDLRWIFNVKSHLFNGQMGLIGFIDNGRVWYKEEDSREWHMGYGGGILIAPFNKIALTIYYGLSQETGRIHLRLGKMF